MRLPHTPPPLTPAAFHARFPDSDEEPGDYFIPNLACQHCGSRKVVIRRAVVRAAYCPRCGRCGTLQHFTLPGLDAYFDNLAFTSSLR